MESMNAPSPQASSSAAMTATRLTLREALRRVGRPQIERAAGAPGERARSLDLRGHVGEQERDGLEMSDRLSERGPLFRVSPCVLERRARAPHGAGGIDPRVAKQR